MTTELVHYDLVDGVAHVVLDSPHNKNALSRQLVSELVERLERAAADPDATVVLLRAEGNVFCSGADLSEASTVPMEQSAAAMVAVFRLLASLEKPVVTQLRGAVRAGGIGIVGASDIVLAAESTTFALTEVRLGLAPAIISLTLLPRLTPRAASLTFLTGDVFDGRAAQEYGLVTRAVPDDELALVTGDVLASLTQGAAQGLRETKKVLNAALLETIDAGAEEMASLSARLFGSDEAREAMTAFLSRRK